MNEEFIFLNLEKVLKENYIHKDKIKRILKKYEKTNVEDYQTIIRFYKDLEELLEEE